MTETNASAAEFAAASKQIARRLLTIGENRLELLRAEVQEQRELLLQAIALALGVLGCVLLAAMTLTAAIVVLLWEHSPGLVLAVLAAIYAASAAFLARRLSALLHEFQAFSDSVEQLRKDRACLEKMLA